MDRRDEGHEAECALASSRGPGTCSWCGSWLPARRKRFCSDHCGSFWADQHVWARAKEAAKEAAGYHCTRCNAAPLGALEVHHRIEVEIPHGYENGCQHHGEGLEVLCHDCHASEHRFRHEVDKLVVWACGTVSRQLTLPGLAA